MHQKSIRQNYIYTNNIKSLHQQPQQQSRKQMNHTNTNISHSNSDMNHSNSNKENSPSLSNATPLFSFTDPNEDSILVTSSIRHSSRLQNQHQQLQAINQKHKKQNKLNANQQNKSDNYRQSTKHSNNIQKEIPFINGQQDMFRNKQVNRISQRQKELFQYQTKTVKQNNDGQSNKKRNLRHQNYSRIREQIHQQCQGCRQQLPLIKQTISRAVSKIEQLERMVKLSFTKTTLIQNQTKINANRLIQIQARIDENYRRIKDHEQIILKSTKANNQTILPFYSLKEGSQLNISLRSPTMSQCDERIQQLEERVNKKSVEVSELVELEMQMVKQKLETLSIKTQQKISCLIQIVEQLAVKVKNQQSARGQAYRFREQSITKHNNNLMDEQQHSEGEKQQKSELKNAMMKENGNRTLNHRYNNYNNHNKYSYDNKNNYTSNNNHKSDNINKNHSIYLSHRRQQRTASLSKSKISYYLSKSNFNDTTLCETSLTPLENIRS